MRGRVPIDVIIELERKEQVRKRYEVVSCARTSSLDLWRHPLNTNTEKPILKRIQILFLYYYIFPNISLFECEK